MIVGQEKSDPDVPLRRGIGSDREERNGRFAFDANDLVILWNKGCEELLGRSAYQVLGRHCYDIMCGRDIYGNLYCCPNCPVTVQAREHPKDPVQRFELDVSTGDGGTRRVAMTTFAIPGPRPSLATLVHVIRIPGQTASPLEGELEEAVDGAADAAGSRFERRKARSRR